MNTAAAVPVQIIQSVVRRFPAVVPHLSPAAWDVLKAAPGYDGIRTVMYGAIFGSVFGYLSGGSFADTLNRMIAAVSKAYIETADAGYQEAGAELPLDADTAAWARAQLDAQFGFIDELFESLKQIRKDGDFDAGAIAAARADSYSSALDGFYNEALLRGNKNVSAVWRLGATEKHCKTCASLDGQSHRISWYIERDYIPRKSGCALDCGGWNCDCRLETKNGEEITL
jgi:hypothetical protein